MEQHLFNIEKNKVVALYSGAKLTPFKMNGNTIMTWQDSIVDRLNGLDENDRLSFPKSWDWQVPVWAKAYKALYEMTPMGEGEIIHQSTVSFMYETARQYRDAFFVNDPQKAFEVLVRVIEYINKRQ